MKVLLIGSGGREHALAWKIAQSPDLTKLYAAPGNPGIAEEAELVSLDTEDHGAVVQFCKDKAIDFVVVGPEAPLVAGIADRLREAGFAVFGPSAAAAQLEGSKGFTKDVCARFNIPTGAYQRFNNAPKAKAYVREQGAPIVIKADGLAAGKGVIVAETVDQAIEAVRDMLSGNRFGAAGASVVIEEFMTGEEASFFALTDGSDVVAFGSAQDHKRVGDGDTGSTLAIGARSVLGGLQDYPLALKIYYNLPFYMEPGHKRFLFFCPFQHTFAFHLVMLINMQQWHPFQHREVF